MSRPPTSSNDVNSIPIAESLNTGTSLTTIRHHTCTDSLQGFNNNQPEFLAHNITPLAGKSEINLMRLNKHTKEHKNEGKKLAKKRVHGRAPSSLTTQLVPTHFNTS